MSPICPCCGSPDTVSYWDIKREMPVPPQDGRRSASAENSDLTLLIMKSQYPDARKCVDCEHLWWRDPIKIDWSRLTIAD